MCPVFGVERFAHFRVLATGSGVHARQSHVHVAAHDLNLTNPNDFNFILRGIRVHIAALRHEEKSGHRG
ncbi:MAG: hypothetical protein EBZ06_09040, partial [Betaproteobacteria bacterium]|nr:hypothetical protein [Betaproteobacteria bacterium]